MILHLRKEHHGDLSLWGESNGVTVPEDLLADILAPVYAHWKAPVLYGRGVLHLLQWCLRGMRLPDVVLGDDVQAALKAFPIVAQWIAAGRVMPMCTHGEARWQLTELPEGYDAALLETLTDLWMRTVTSTALTRAQTRRHTFYSAADAWLNALRVPSATMAVTDSVFERDVRTWAAAAFATAHLQLTLTEKEGTWGYTFGEASPENLLLLGQAIALAPALAAAQPWDKAQLQTFLSSAVPALRAAGFTVDLPAALEPRVPEMQITVHTLTEHEVVQLEQHIHIGALSLSIAEAQALVDAGDPLVYHAGEWHYLDLRALEQRLAEAYPPEMPLRRALPLLLSGELRVAPTAHQVQTFLRQLTSPPEGHLPLRETLRPYQAQGVCWMMQAAANGLGVCLADDMGLGKTIQAIALLLTRKSPALVVAPLTVLPVWERELQRFAPSLRIYRHEGADRLTVATFRHNLSHVDVVLTAYNYLWRDFSLFRKPQWETLILDEAQVIKNPLTRQSQAARALTANTRIALTGTPIENALSDLWSILDFLNPNLFGTCKAFCERYTTPAKLQRMVSHFMLRRLKSDPAVATELPPKIAHDLFTPLTTVQAQAYDAALTTYATEAETLPEAHRRGAVLTLLMRLRQICDHPDLPLGEPPTSVAHSGKLLALLPLLEEILAKGESALIFTQFVPMGKALQNILTEHLGIPVPFVHGNLTAKQRQAELKAFNTHKEPSVLILSLRTGAFGLTLTKANHVIHFDRWWNPAVEAQATDRVHRIGQEKTVIVHTLRCRGTLEDRIDALLQQKQTLADTVVPPTPTAVLTALPTEALLDILKR